MKKEYLAVGFVPGEGFRVCPIHLVDRLVGHTVTLDSRKKRWRPEVEGAPYVPLGSPQPDSAKSPVLTVYDPTDWSNIEKVLNFIHGWKVPENFESQEQARRRIQKDRMNII